MNENFENIAIKDIKAPVEIPDMGLYILYGISFLAIVVVLYILLRTLMALRAGKRKNSEKEWLEELYHIDWSSPKKAAYKITKYGRKLALDDRRRELFSQLSGRLERYKYKKSVEPVDRETVKLFELYRKVCDESI